MLVADRNDREFLVALLPFSLLDKADADGLVASQVDVWNITDLENPTPLIPEFAYAAAVTTDLPAGAYTVCLDVNKDATCDATFELPQLDGGFINLIATNDTAGVPSLVAILETGDTVEIAAK